MVILSTNNLGPRLVPFERGRSGGVSGGDGVPDAVVAECEVVDGQDEEESNNKVPDPHTVL